MQAVVVRCRQARYRASLQAQGVGRLTERTGGGAQRATDCGGARADEFPIYLQFHCWFSSNKTTTGTSQEDLRSFLVVSVE
jgi:hypothetical protein